VGWFICKGWTDPITHVTPRKHGPQSGFREPRAGKVDPLLAAATLNGGSPNLTGTDGAWVFWVCWVTRGRAKVRVNVSADK